MIIDRRIIERLMFGTGRVRRFTQDSPVLPDVWLEYAKSESVRLLLTPFRETPPGEIARELRERLQVERRRKEWKAFGHSAKATPRIVYNQTTVAATLYFEDLIRAVVP